MGSKKKPYPNEKMGKRTKREGEKRSPTATNYDTPVSEAIASTIVPIGGKGQEFSSAKTGAPSP